MYDALLIIPEDSVETGEAVRKIIALFVSNSLDAGIFIVSERNKEKFDDPRGEQSCGSAGTGTLADLYAAVISGKIETRSLWWVDDPDRLLQTGRLIRELWSGLEAGNDLVIAVHSSVPLTRKIPGMLFFPEWKDPFSGIFVVERDAFLRFGSPGLRGPLLPHFLSRIPWNGVIEVPGPGYEKQGIRNNYGVGSRVRGLAQILCYALSEEKSPLRTEMGKIARFALVGLSGILVNTGFLYIFTEIGGIFYLASSALAIEISILTNFILNDFWTFKSRTGLIRQRWKRLASYNFLALGGMAVNLGVLYGLTAGFDVYYLYANIIGILFAFLWNYLTNRNITWK
jgi:putative flippase GtrA